MLYAKTIKLRKREPVEHFTDGRRAWLKEGAGLVQTRHQLIFAAFFLLLAILPLPEIRISLRSVIVASTLILILGLHYLKIRVERSLKMKHKLHMISHYVRDRYIDMNRDSDTVEIGSISSDLCYHIKEYFSVLTNKEDIGVAIRCAKRIDGQTYYSTVGRAGLSMNRSATTQDLHEDEGLAKLCKRATRGVFVINNIDDAEKAGALVKDYNYEAYSDDLATLMVSPINGWDGVDKGMLGLLFVTSTETNVFGEKYTDSMGFISDALANIYSELIMSRLTTADDGRIIHVKEDKYKYKGEGSEPIKIT